MSQNASSDEIRITSQFIDEQYIFNKFLPASYLQIGILQVFFKLVSQKSSKFTISILFVLIAVSLFFMKTFRSLYFPTFFTSGLMIDLHVRE